jgi:putative SOS response-associated peptidase YedK
VLPGLVGQNGLMCGRYVMSKATGDLLSYFDAKEVEGTPPPPSWNVAPTQDVPIIAERLADSAPSLLALRRGAANSSCRGGAT